MMSRLRLQELLLFLLLLFHQLLTLAPALYSGDSGELVGAAYILGVPHPTGFAAYLCLGKALIFMIPLGNIAYKMNLLSALCAALAAFFVYLIAGLLGWKRWIAFWCAVIVISGRSFWLQGSIARVYSLLALIFSVVIYLSLLWLKNGDKRLIYLAFFIIGLGSGVHLHSLILLPVATFFVVRIRHRTVALMMAICLLMLILGASVTLYVPIRANTEVDINYVYPRNFTRLVSYMTQEGYSFKMFSRSYEQALIFIDRILSILAQREYTCIGFVVFLLGLLSLILKPERRIIVLLLIPLLNIYWMYIYGYQGDIGFIERYLLPSLLVMVLVSGYGLHRMLDVGMFRGRFGSFAFKSSAFAFSTFLVIANMIKVDRSDTWLPFDFGHNILKSMDQGGIVFLQGDNIVYAVFYLVECEKMRPDILAIERQRSFWPSRDRLLPSLPWRDLQLYAVLHSPADVYTTTMAMIEQRESYEHCGIIYRLKRSNLVPASCDDSTWELFSWRGIGNPPGYLDFTLRDLYVNYHVALGERCSDMGDKEKSLQHYLKAADLCEDMSRTLNGLGIIIARQGKEKVAQRIFQRVLLESPCDTQALYQLGLLAMKHKDWATARHLLTSALYSDSSFSPSLEALAELYLQAGLYEATALNRFIHPFSNGSSAVKSGL